MSTFYSTATIQAALVPLVGITLILVAFAQHRYHTRLRREGELVRGTILRFDWHEGSWFPVVRFCTRQQQWITARYLERSELDRFTQGDQVAIRYNPADPLDFAIVPAELTGRIWLLGLTGGGLLLYSVVRFLGA